MGCGAQGQMSQCAGDCLWKSVNFFATDQPAEIPFGASLSAGAAVQAEKGSPRTFRVQEILRSA